MRSRHLTIARLARERGFIDAAVYAQVLIDLAARGAELEHEPLDVFWIVGGRLQETQLATVLAAASALPSGRVTRRRVGWLLPGGQTVPLSELTPGGLSSTERAPPTPKIDRYEVGERIGTGGMGDVFEARDLWLDRLVALKVPRPGVDQSVLALLAQEARLAGQLEHPAIVPVYDAGVKEGVGPYYAMRLLHQPTLEEVIARLATGEVEATREYTLARLLRCFVQICLAVQYAHTRGVIHCDLKPANVVVGEFAEVLILDWGMAFKLDGGTVIRGGTPGYVAPEQLRAGAVVDGRTDVFALGAVLYEILCFQPAYGDEAVGMVLKVAAGQAVYPSPEPPGRRRSDVPEELEQVCLKAMSIDAAARHPSARELAADVEAFIEGRRERERRVGRATELMEQGSQLADMYHEYVASRPQLVEEVAQRRAAVAPWEPAARKRDVWDAEDRLAGTDVVGVRTFQAAVATYEQALEEVPGHPLARRGLATLYASEVERARARHDELNRIYFEELLKQNLDAAALTARAEGTLSVTAMTGEARVTLSELEEQDRRQVPRRARSLGVTPVTARLRPGTYWLELEADGAARRTSCPVTLAADAEVGLDFDLAALARLEPWERYVPAGVALLGGDESSPWGRDLIPVEVGAFVVGADPVTFAEYLPFLEEHLQRGDQDTFVAHLPQGGPASPYWRWEGGHFVAAASLQASQEEALALPAFGVTLASAVAYLAWRSARGGRAFRLLREEEWEKAARGTDGRAYPWGDHFDASFCKMYQSRPGRARPEPPGSFTADLSPYGLRDMAGGVADWVVGATGGGDVDVARGGAWCDWQAECHLGVRRSYQRGHRLARVGFRLARDP